MALKRKTAFPVDEKDIAQTPPVTPTLEQTRQKPLKKGWKYWKVYHIDTPNDYEYVAARSEREAIAKSSFIDKDDLFANEKPDKNCFIIDIKNGSYETFIEDKKIHDEIPDAKIYDFEGTPMYYLFREYKDGSSKLVPYTRPGTDKKVMVSPDMLYDAIHWTDSLNKVLKTKDIFSMEKLSTPLILGVLGLLILLIVMLADM